MGEPTDHAGVLETLSGELARNQVFGEPVSQGDTTLVPVADVRLGGGSLNAEGGGLGLVARPAGAFAVSANGKVAWHPAVNVNWIVWGGQLALATATTAVAFAIAFRRKRPR